MRKQFRVTYAKPGDCWCRYFATYKRAMSFLNQMKENGYKANVVYVPEL